MPRYKCPVVIRGVHYESQKEAAEALGVHPCTIQKALNEGRLEAVGLFDNNRVPVTIRGVRYSSMTAAAKAFGINQSVVRRAANEGRLETVGLGRNASTKRKVWVDGVEYESQAAAARAMDVSAHALQWMLIKHRRDGVHEFEYMGHKIKQEQRND